MIDQYSSSWTYGCKYEDDGLIDVDCIGLQILVLDEAVVSMIVRPELMLMRWLMRWYDSNQMYEGFIVMM